MLDRRSLPASLLLALLACQDSSGGDGPPAEPEPIGDLSVTDSGASVSAVTTGLEDTVVGPIVVGDVTFTLRIPAVAIEPGVEITMTPVSLGDTPFTSFGAFRFGPPGTTFLVPATLTAEGLPDVAVASAVLDDDGRGTVLTFVPRALGVADAPIEHFSIASILDAATATAAIGAAGIAVVPTSSIEASEALAASLADVVGPAIEGADDSLVAFALARRLQNEWGAAVQGRGLESSPFSGLGGRTFGQAGADAVDDLVVAGQKLLADLSKPTCVDGTGQLSHPFDWFGALAYVAKELQLLGGNAATPDVFSPCLTIAFPSAVTSQGGAISHDQRFVQVFVGIDATTPDGSTAPMPGSYVLEVTGAVDLDGNDTIFFEAPSRGLAPVDLDRGNDCADRASTLGVTVTGSLKGALGLANLSLAPVVTSLAFVEAAGSPVFAAGPDSCPVPTISISPAFVILAPETSQQFIATSSPAGLEVTWAATGGTIDQQGNFTAGLEQSNIVVEAISVLDGSVAGSASVAIIRPDLHTSTSSDANSGSGVVSQFNAWGWTLDCTAIATTSEVTLSRAERFAAPASPAFTMTVPITSVSSQGLVLRGTVPDLEFFNVTFFSGGEVRVDARGPGLPQGLCVFCNPQSLFDVVAWANIFFPM